MGSLTEGSFTELVERGCSVCGAKKLAIRSYVEGKFSLLEGEPVGPVAWAYKGENFVNGVYAVVCAACAHSVFSEVACPVCRDPEGLTRALETENRHAVPKACPSCAQIALTYRAFVPAAVVYEGKRAHKARPVSGLYDAGFHGIGFDCKTCGSSAPHQGSCFLCGADRRPHS